MSDAESHLGPWVISAGKAYRCSENIMHHSKNQWFQQQKVNDTKWWPTIRRAHAVPGYGLGCCVMNSGPWQQLSFKTQEKMLAHEVKNLGKGFRCAQLHPPVLHLPMILASFILVDISPSSSSHPYDCIYYVALTASKSSYVQSTCFLSESLLFHYIKKSFYFEWKQWRVAWLFQYNAIYCQLEWLNMF